MPTDINMSTPLHMHGSAQLTLSTEYGSSIATSALARRSPSGQASPRDMSPSAPAGTHRAWKLRHVAALATDPEAAKTPPTRTHAREPVPIRGQQANMGAFADDATMLEAWTASARCGLPDSGPHSAFPSAGATPSAC